VEPTGAAGREPTGHDLIRTATNAACLRLWQGVVVQVLVDVEAGLRILRGGPAPSPDRASKRRERLREARAAAAWLFGPVGRRDRDWICGWLDLEPRCLQAAVRRQHGDALDALLTGRPHETTASRAKSAARLHRSTDPSHLAG
jgi:hypothetical protein